MTNTEPQQFELEQYGNQWLVYVSGDCIPVQAFFNKREAQRWIRANKSK